MLNEAVNFQTLTVCLVPYEVLAKMQRGPVCKQCLGLVRAFSVYYLL